MVNSNHEGYLLRIYHGTEKNTRTGMMMMMMMMMMMYRAFS